MKGAHNYECTLYRWKDAEGKQSERFAEITIYDLT